MNLPRYQSSLLQDLPAVRHGFFTRKGGCSEGIYASLNCGPGSDDKNENVMENRKRVLANLSCQAELLCGLYQIHSNKVEFLETPWDINSQPKADAVVTRLPHIALGILTADCAPVLFADPVNGVIAAAHAGWQGALEGILQNTVDMMCAKGAKRAAIIAVIGPCISQENYQVGQEFLEKFTEKNSTHTDYFTPDHSAEKYLFDLRRFVSDQLVETKIGAIDPLSLDTYAMEKDFFSYRRTTHKNEPDYGRQISAIMLSGPTP